MQTIVLVCAELSGKEPHRYAGHQGAYVVKWLAHWPVMQEMWGLIPALGAIVTIFFTPLHWLL